MTATPVDVVVASHNGAAFLPDLIGTCYASTGVDVRILVIDNASTDGSPEIARSHGADLVELKMNKGFGMACNEGLRRATAEWVAFANQDLEFEPGALASLVSTCEAVERRSGRPAVVGPLLLDSSGRPALSCRRLPSLSRQILTLLAGERLAGMKAPTRSSQVQSCGWLPGALILGRASTFHAVRGFDPRYFMYVEDVDLFDRLRAAGTACVWAPGASVVHRGGRRPVAPHLHADALRNWMLFFRTRRGPGAGAMVLAAGVAGSVVKGLAWRIKARRNVPEARAYAHMLLGGAWLALRPPSSYRW